MQENQHRQQQDQDQDQDQGQEKQQEKQQEQDQQQQQVEKITPKNGPLDMMVVEPNETEAALSRQEICSKLACSLNNSATIHHSLGRHETALLEYQASLGVRAEAVRPAKEATAASQDPEITAKQHSNTVSLWHRLEETLQEEEKLGAELHRATGSSVPAVASLDLYELEEGVDSNTEESGRRPSTSFGRGGTGAAGTAGYSPLEVYCDPIRLSPYTPMGEDHNRSSAATLFNMGLCHLQNCSLDKALQLFDMALSITNPETDASLAALLMNHIAQVEYRQDLPAEAAATLGEALHVERRALSVGPNKHPTDIASSSVLIGLTAQTLSLLGRIHYARGDPTEALDYARESLRLLRRIHQEHDAAPSIDVASMQYNVGLILRRMGGADRMSEAVGCVQSFISVSVASTTTPPSIGYEAETATALFSLGCIHLDMHSVTNATRCFADALSLRRLTFGPNHETVAVVSFRLGKLYFDVGQYDRALGLYRESLRIARVLASSEPCSSGTASAASAAEGPRNSHPSSAMSEDVATVLCYIGQVHHSRGELDEALCCYTETLRVARHLFGHVDRFVAAMLGVMGNVYAEAGMHEDAFRCFADATRITQQRQQQQQQQSVGSNIEGDGGWPGGQDAALVSEISATAQAPSTPSSSSSVARAHAGVSGITTATTAIASSSTIPRSSSSSTLWGALPPYMNGPGGIMDPMILMEDLLSNGSPGPSAVPSLASFMGIDLYPCAAAA